MTRPQERSLFVVTLAREVKMASPIEGEGDTLISALKFGTLPIKSGKQGIRENTERKDVVKNKRIKNGNENNFKKEENNENQKEKRNVRMRKENREGK